MRRVAVRRLKELGYAVIEADGGPAALRILDREEPLDLLFTDIVMAGGITGVDLAQEARRRRPGLKILLTSGYAEPAVRQGCSRLVERRLARQALQQRRAPDEAPRAAGPLSRPPSTGFHGTGEDVAAASDRLDQGRICRIGFELLAQPADLRVDGAVIGRPTAPFHQLDELVAAEDPIGVLCEGA